MHPLLPSSLSHMATGHDRIVSDFVLKQQSDALSEIVLGLCNGSYSNLVMNTLLLNEI